MMTSDRLAEKLLDLAMEHLPHPPGGWTTIAHFNAVKDWPNALECLRWACEHGATVAEMDAWRRANGWPAIDTTKYGEGE